MVARKKATKKKAVRKKKVAKKATKKKAILDIGKDLHESDSVEPTCDEDFPEIKYKYGRPTKYQEKFCDYALHYLAQGYSKEALAGIICVTKSTLYEWIKTYPNFSNAIAIGEGKSRTWWENTTVKHVVHTKNGKQINGQVYGLNMKNRFNWQDKKEIAIEEETKKVFAFNLDEEPDEVD